MSYLTVLLTGFVPFGGDDYNPSGECAKNLNRHPLTAMIGGNPIVATLIGIGQVPVVFHDDKNPQSGDTGAGTVAAAIARYLPDVVISLGMAAGSKFRVEREAHNVIAYRNTDNLHQHYTSDDAHRTPDGRGYYHHGSSLVKLDTALPIDAVETAIGKQNCIVSNDPGAFVCEDVMFEVLTEIADPKNGQRLLRGGFIHVPTTFPQPIVDAAILRAVQATVDSITPEELASHTRSSRFSPIESGAAVPLFGDY